MIGVKIINNSEAFHSQVAAFMKLITVTLINDRRMSNHPNVWDYKPKLKKNQFYFSYIINN